MSGFLLAVLWIDLAETGCQVLVLWGERNGVLHWGRRRSASILAEVADVLMLDSNLRHSRPRGKWVRGNWRPLDVGSLILNTDAAVMAGTGNFGMGAVIQDHSVIVLALQSKQLVGFHTVEDDEASALLDGL